MCIYVEYMKFLWLNLWTGGLSTDDNDANDDTRRTIRDCIGSSAFSKWANYTGVQLGYDFRSETVPGVCFGYKFRTPKDTPPIFARGGICLPVTPTIIKLHHFEKLMKCEMKDEEQNVLKLGS